MNAGSNIRLTLGKPLPLAPFLFPLFLIRASLVRFIPSRIVSRDSIRGLLLAEGTPESSGETFDVSEFFQIRERERNRIRDILEEGLHHQLKFPVYV